MSEEFAEAVVIVMQINVTVRSIAAINVMLNWYSLSQTLYLESLAIKLAET